MTVPRESRGFTLIEMVVTLVLAGIVAGITASFISGPMLGYTQTTRRAELVDAAEQALRRMARDIRRALPNSVRVDPTGRVLEMLNTVDAGRYRDDPPPGNPAALLTFTSPDDEFDTIGALQNFAEVDTSNDQVVIYNLSATGAANNAYVGDNRQQLAPGATTATHIQLAAPLQFPLASPRQRFYIVDTPVTYLCDLGAGTLSRFWGYAITHPHAAVDSAVELSGVGAASALMTRHVANCTFSYQPGTSQRAGLVTLRLELSDQGERVTLLHQVHVYNTP
ncbi:MAG: type II secretion system protein [Gammaproteobacteria bacterium]